MPARFDEEFLIWVAAEQPLKDTSFLSGKILALCEELPIYWLQPMYPKGFSSFSACMSEVTMFITLRRPVITEHLRIVHFSKVHPSFDRACLSYLLTCFLK